MRIVHFLNHTRRANGHVEIGVDLACAQVAQGHEVAIVSGRGDFDYVLRDNGVEFVEVREIEGKRGALSLAISLTRFARRFRAQIVNAHMVKAAVIARGVRRATTQASGLVGVNCSWMPSSPQHRVAAIAR